jgi:hypothetical protein
MSADEILLQVESLDAQQRAFIAITKDQILEQVDDMAQELTGLIDVQAGAVNAIVEGGGAAGQMSLSLNLPVMIDATKRAQLVTASTEAKVAAVYALVEDTDYYAIKPSASNADVKALWDDAVAAGLIASQIELQADQIYLNGEVIVNEDSKIKAALIDVENLLATNIAIKDKGVIHSDNYNGTIDADGNITGYGSAGWAIDHAGKSDFVNINATGGTFSNVEVSGTVNAASGQFEGGLGAFYKEDNFVGWREYPTQQYVNLDDLETISGILVVYQGTNFIQTGSYPFVQYHRQYDKVGVYFYSYNSQYGQIFPDIGNMQDRTNLVLTKLAGSNMLSVITDPNATTDKIIRLSNMVDSAAQRFYKIINLKIFTPGYL